MRKIIKKNIYENVKIPITSADPSHRCLLEMSPPDVPHIFIFHCANFKASEWRQLKNKLPDAFIINQPVDYAGPKRLPHRIYACHSWDSGHLLLNESAINKDHCNSLSTSACELKHKISVNIPVGPSMLLCFKKHDEQKMEISTFKVLQTVESFNSKNLILFYAQSNFTILNHKDIKHIANFSSIKQLYNLLSNNLLFASVDLLALLKLKCS